MPVVLLERLPLPSLRTYTTISVALLASAVYYAHKVVTEENDENVNKTETHLNDSQWNTSITNGTDPPEEGYVMSMAGMLFQEAWCIWTIVNMTYCCLILLGKFIQKIVFGELRVSEEQHIKDKFWNFVFYKFIFIFGVMNVQNMDEVVAWCAWFSVLGFLHLLSQLCKDRFEYLSSSPTRPNWTHAKVLMLLCGIQLMVCGLFVLCIIVGIPAGFNTFAFMLAECCLLGIKTLYVMVRYAIHLWDLNHEGVWENRAIYVYYAEFIFEMSSLSIDFTHHLHMLLWGNIFLSMASLVICMQLRYLFHEFQRRVRRHKNYLRVVNSMQAKFPMATAEDLDQNSDNCAICWDKMENARKLPCGHLFHNSCLRSWLEQDTSCPTCRQSLSDPQENIAQPLPVVPAPEGPGPLPIPVPGVNQMLNTGGPVNTTNHFFHFDGSRYVSWLPSFSVEVTHTQLMANGPQPAAVQTSQLDNMARQVQSVFPSMPLATIMEDLRVTHSVEVTIENILEERLVAPPVRPSPTSSQESSSGSEVSAGGSGDGPSTEDQGAGEGTSQSATSSLASSDSPELDDEVQPGTSLNFVQDDNIPDLLSAEDEPNESGDANQAIGFRFSKSPVERESMLVFRKESLLEQARRRFLNKHGDDPLLSSTQEDSNMGLESGSDSDSSLSANSRLELSSPSTLSNYHHDELSHRRELAYQAAQRRINRH